MRSLEIDTIVLPDLAEIWNRLLGGGSMGPEQLNTLTDIQAKLLCDQLREQIVAGEIGRAHV